MKIHPNTPQGKGSSKDFPEPYQRVRIQADIGFRTRTQSTLPQGISASVPKETMDKPRPH